MTRAARLGSLSNTAATLVGPQHGDPGRAAAWQRPGPGPVWAAAQQRPRPDRNIAATAGVGRAIRQQLEPGRNRDSSDPGRAAGVKQQQLGLACMRDTPAIDSNSELASEMLESKTRKSNFKLDLLLSDGPNLSMIVAT